MDKENLYRGKRTDTGEWIEGYYACIPLTGSSYILTGPSIEACKKGAILFEGYQVEPGSVELLWGV